MVWDGRPWQCAARAISVVPCHAPLQCGRGDLTGIPHAEEMCVVGTGVGLMVYMACGIDTKNHSTQQPRPFRTWHWPDSSHWVRLAMSGCHKKWPPSPPFLCFLALGRSPTAYGKVLRHDGPGGWSNTAGESSTRGAQQPQHGASPAPACHLHISRAYPGFTWLGARRTARTHSTQHSACGQDIEPLAASHTVAWPC